MWTRERLLSAIELAGFVAIAVAVAGFGWVTGGPAVAASAGMLAGGASAVYLANAYAMPNLDDDEEPDE